MMNQELGRRDFIVSLSAFMAALSFAPEAVWAQNQNQLALPLAVGETYLKLFGEESGIAKLKAKINGSVNSLLEQQAALDDIREMIANDYLVDQTFEFENWLLSKTEGRLCALAMLEKNPIRYKKV